MVGTDKSREGPSITKCDNIIAAMNSLLQIVLLAAICGSPWGICGSPGQPSEVQPWGCVGNLQSCRPWIYNRKPSSSLMVLQPASTSDMAI